MRYAVYERLRGRTFCGSLTSRQSLPPFETNDLEDAVADCLSGIKAGLHEFILDRRNGLIIDLESWDLLPVSSCFPCSGGRCLRPLVIYIDSRRKMTRRLDDCGNDAGAPDR